MKTLLQRHRRIATETAWVFAGQGASAIAALVGLRLITEMVPPTVYGPVALALGVVTLAHGLAVGPYMQATLRFYPDLARQERAAELRRATLLALRKPTLLALVALSAFGVGWCLWQPQDTWLVMLSIALFAAEAARSVELVFLNAARQQRAMALFVASDALLRPTAAVSMIWLFGANGAAVLGGYLMGCLIAFAAFRLMTARRRRTDVQPATATSRLADISHRLRYYALPLTALPLIGWVSGQADRYFLAALVSPEATGLYAALYGLASRPFLMFSASVELALRQPYYARASSGDRSAERRAIAAWLGVVASGSLALLLLFAFFHVDIAALVLAPEYRVHSVLLAWIAAGYVLMSTAQVFERVCYAHHDTSGVLRIQVSGAAFSVVVTVPLVYLYGIEGAGWAVPVYFGAQLLIATLRARRSWRREARAGATAAVPVVGQTVR